MEHPCHRCGAPIAEGAPFCSQCGAPQIRVAAPEIEPATTPLPPGTPDDVQPPALPVVPFQTGRIDWRVARPRIVAVGLMAGLLSVFAPIRGVGFFAWILLAGFVAVRLYSNYPGARVTASGGAKLGAVTGLAAFAVWTAMFLLSVGLNGPEMRANVQKSMQEWVTQYPSPQANQVVGFVSTPEGFATLITISIVMALMVFLVGSALSGAVGGVVFGKEPR